MNLANRLTHTAASAKRSECSINSGSYRCNTTSYNFATLAPLFDLLSLAPSRPFGSTIAAEAYQSNTYISHTDPGLCLAMSSFLSFNEITQPLTPSGDNSRMPFVPVRKHGKGSTSPPPSPLPQQQRTTRSMAPPPARLSSTASVASTSSPLLPSSVHNVPAFALHTASPPPEFRTPAMPRKVLSSQPQHQQPQQAPSSPLTLAPKVRAKLTPAATPRRKNFLPGTEFADVPARRTDAGYSPVKRAPPPPPLAVTPSTPMGRPMAPPASYGSFPSYNEDAFDMSAMSGGLAGLGVRSRVERSTKGKDNVLVCVRIRPPAAKLAAATTLVEERAWDVDEQSGRLTLKTGHPEFTFGV